MTFSNSSMLMALLFSNILLMILYFIFRNTRFMIDIGYKLLGFFIIITLLRFLFPFEIAYSTNILLPETLSEIIIFFKTPFIDIGNYSLSVWHIFLIVWLTGSCIAVIRFTLSYRSFHQMVVTAGTDISSEEPYRSLIEEICEKHHKKNRFHIVSLSEISSPMITGIRQPYILLPENFHVEEQDMYYILSHEAAHFFHHDLLLKLLSQFLCMIYWWNPFVRFLKQQIATMLELRIDLHITSSPDPQDRINYLNCLINAAKAETSVPAFPAISFCNAGESLLTQRFSIIINNSQKKTNRRKQLLCSFLVVGLYAFSIIFIFEPHVVPPEVAAETFDPNYDKCYFIETSNGEYHLYVNDQFYGIINDALSIFPDIPVYKSLEEAESE